MTEEDDPCQAQLEDTSFDALYAEIQAQLEAIEARSRWVEWPFTTVSSSTAWTLDAAPVSPASKKPKPVRPKVRYRARWRKEQIERKLRRV